MCILASKITTYNRKIENAVLSKLVKFEVRDFEKLMKNRGKIP
jgi:hypothetical protein